MAKEVIIHCSDSDFGNAAMIDGWHAQRGFKNKYGVHIGYHLVILNGKLTVDLYNEFFDGLLETGRGFNEDSQISWNEMAAATLGHNEAIQVCLIGKTGEFTSSQLLTLQTKVLPLLRHIFGEIEVGQHSDYDPINKAYCAGLTSGQIKFLNKK